MTTTTRTFQRGETIVCSLVVTNQAGTQIDADTSVKITIIDPAGTAVVDDQVMAHDGTGLYHYDYTPGAEAVLGSYAVRYEVVHSQRTTITDDRFLLEA